MRALPLFLAAFLAACQATADTADDANGGDGTTASPPDTPLRPASPRPEAATGDWSDAEGALRFADEASGADRMLLTCRAGRLRVTLPGVAPIGSEERLSFGGGGDVEVLVRSPGTGHGGVEATGPAPDAKRLLALLGAGPGASYGATAIGPLVPVPAEMAATFVKACA